VGLRLACAVAGDRYEDRPERSPDQGGHFSPDRFEVAAFINNLWDEQARLALDYERGRSARVGYLTNTPRTYGVSARWEF
jgi:outer membrane receptor protein involved in Fe transport